MANNGRAERRRERREMHVDRRKSDIDVFEHVALGIRGTHGRAASNDSPRRARIEKLELPTDVEAEQGSRGQRGAKGERRSGGSEQ
jgi:hypothetical protein